MFEATTVGSLVFAAHTLQSFFSVAVSPLLEVHVVSPLFARFRISPVVF